jgi:hypothetical protein
MGDLWGCTGRAAGRWADRRDKSFRRRRGGIYRIDFVGGSDPNWLLKKNPPWENAVKIDREMVW